MGRKEERAGRKLERNPVVECNRVRKKYCPELFQNFGDTQDPRHQSYDSQGNLMKETYWAYSDGNTTNSIEYIYE